MRGRYVHSLAQFKCFLYLCSVLTPRERDKALTTT
nr:MAG TPA: hypothetical protein [Caudoviricetes sp.]